MSETTNPDEQRPCEEGELHLRSVIEAIPAAVFLTSQNHTRVDYLSSHFTHVLGYTLEDLPTVDRWYELAYPDPEQRSAVMANTRQGLERSFRNSKCATVVRSLVTCKDGSQRHMLWHARNLDGRLLGSGFDLTESLRAERERHEMNARLHSVAANVPGVLYQMHLRPDGTSHFPFASSRLHEIHGVTPEQVIEDGTPIFETIHPEDVKTVRDAFKTSAGNIAPLRVPFRVCLGGTRIIWVETEATPERMTDGGVLWHGHSRDITARVETDRALKEAQGRLQRSERLLRDIESVSRSGGWEYLVDTNEIFWTAELYALHEFPSEDIRHIEDSLSCYRPEDRELVRSAFERCVRDGVGYDLELPFTTHLGHARWVRTKTQAIVECGRVTRVIGSVMDITERKQAEAELLLVTKAVEQSAGAIVITDPDGVIRYVNPAFTRASGYSRDEAIGRNPRFLQSGLHDPEFYEQMWSTITSGRDWVGRTSNRRKDGSLFTEEAVISPVRDAAGRIVNYISTKRDITEELRAEAERLAMQEQLHRAQKLESIGRLAGGVAHDFNNLLMVILTVAELSRDDLREDDPLRHDLQEILDAGQRAASLTRQLLAFSRKQTLAPEVLDINRLIEGLKKMLGRLIGEHIALELELADELDPILADPGQLEQVFMNLVVNARDAMPRGGTLRIATANTHRGRPGVSVFIVDTGCGMSPDVLKQIFEPFFTTKPLGRGTGLGLSTVLGIVKQSGGDIEVTSEVDKGTTFKMFFPSTSVVQQPRTRPTKGGPVSGHGEKILVVEDEESLRRMIKRLLLAKGYAVTTASNAGEALLLVEERGLVPDLVLVDLVMPLVGGKELIERLRRSHPDQRAIYMSGHAEAPMIPDGLGDASTPFLQKPFSSDELERKVREVLENTPAGAVAEG